MADIVSAARDERGLIRIARAILVVAVACATTSAPGGQGDAKRPTAEDFFRWPLVSDAELSPDGRLLAMTAIGGNGRSQLFVADLAKPLELRGLVSIRSGDVTYFSWVNSRRLVYGGEDLQSDQDVFPVLSAIAIELFVVPKSNPTVIGELLPHSRASGAPSSARRSRVLSILP